LYLYGVILKEKSKKEEAKAVFAEALTKLPQIWSAWLELGTLITQGDDSRKVF
jgi:TolA-binding protein